MRQRYGLSWKVTTTTVMIMKILSLLFAATLALGASATVPQRRTLTCQQPDGTSLTLTMEANGRYATFTTTDGIALLRNSEGHYCYAQLTDHELVSTGRIAHEVADRSAEEQTWVASLCLTQTEAVKWLDAKYPRPCLSRNGRSAASTPDGLGKYKQSGGGVVNSIGAPVIPVVMVDFADRAFQDTIDAQKVTRFFNEKGYADEKGSKGSVKDYFTAQSQGLFTPSFEVVAHVTVPEGYAYYGKDANNGAIDMKVSQLIEDALRKAEKTVNFKRFDTGNGVPLVTIMFAGAGQQSAFENGSEDYIWAHFSTRSFTVNNNQVRINSYFVGNELLQSYGKGPNDVTDAHMDGVGLFCHEFGHALGLPDFYYTGSDATLNRDLLTMDYWSIMDYGQYYFNGYAPPGYTAFERSTLGWLDVKELTEPQFAQLYPFGKEAEGPTAYVIRNPENECEYFLLENRQPDTWYPKRMGAGMLVTHVDYSARYWANNTVNNDPNHQRMAYVPADNKKDGTRTSPELTLSQLFNGYKGDLFPGTQNVTSFTDETTPAMRFYNCSTDKVNRPIYNIVMSTDGVIAFSFRDASLTGIDAVTQPDDTDNVQVYTLSGRRVVSLQTAAPGVYILSNGQKVIKR